MAIVKMSKFKLALFASEKDALLERLQTFGAVHVTEQEEPDKELLQEAPLLPERSTLQARRVRLEEAIDTLRATLPPPEHLTDKLGNALPKADAEEEKAVSVGKKDVDAALEAVQAENEAMRRASEKIKSNAEKKAELSRWKKLDITRDDINAMQSVKAMIGTIPQRWADETRQFIAKEAQGTYLEFLSGDARVYYVFLLTNGRDKELANWLRDVNFQPFSLEGEGTIAQQIEELDKDTREQEKAIADGKVHLKRLCESSLKTLEIAYEEDARRLALLDAQDQMLYSQYLTFLEGYVPTDRADDFRQTVEGDMPTSRYALEIEPADPEDPNVPILLKNNAIAKPFESIVKTYSLPLYKEMDPTGLIAPWYILFFSIMLGDFGYGALLFLGTTLALRFFHWKEATETSLRFFQVLSVPTMLVGLCFGSIFGGLIPMKALIIDPTKDFMTMIVVSVALGFIHILVGLGLKGWQQIREGHPMDVVYDVISWMLILVGLVMVALVMLFKGPDLLKTIGFVMAIVGAVLIFLFSAREEKGIGRFTWGLYNLYGATGYIGDLVSYTRLTAIMLAGAYIGYAMNMIGGMLTNLGVPGYVLAAVIIVGAHLFNLFLSSLSSYVHAMRLIYVEFFGKFFEGGGKPFRGLQPEPKYVDLSTQKKS